MPIFVKIEKHHEIASNMSTIRSKIGTARNTLEKVKALKKQEDEEIATWEMKLRGIEDRMRFLEQAMKQEEK